MRCKGVLAPSLTTCEHRNNDDGNVKISRSPHTTMEPPFPYQLGRKLRLMNTCWGRRPCGTSIRSYVEYAVEFTLPAYTVPAPARCPVPCPILSERVPKNAHVQLYPLLQTVVLNVYDRRLLWKNRGLRSPSFVDAIAITSEGPV